MIGRSAFGGAAALTRFPAMALIVFAVLSGAARPCAANQCSPGPGITTPRITSPTTANNGVGINGEVTFTCSTCSDRDIRTTPGGTMPVGDSVTYTWWAQAGSFPNGNTGTTVLWRAPDDPDYLTVRVTVNDVDGRAQPGCGSDDDPPVSTQLNMHVIRINKVRLYFYNYHTGYPYLGGAFDTRAVVWMTCDDDDAAYCGLTFDTTRQWWWSAGSEGPGGDDQPPVNTPMFQGTPVGLWPSFLPPVQIEWKLLGHVASDPLSGSNRRYWYNESVYLSNSWGEDNRSYSRGGLHRLRATAKLHPGTPWEQSKTSLDREYALRICTKDPSIYQEPNPPPPNSAQRRSYLEWLSTYEEEPYEWGGEGFGGRDSGGQYVGGADSYDGYAIDCSGLVSCGAHRASYNWSWWRQITASLPSVSTPVASPWMDNLTPGDIINKPYHHVMSYRRQIGTTPDRVFYVIEAFGQDNSVPRDNIALQRTRSETYLGQGCEHVPQHYYQGRVLTSY